VGQFGIGVNSHEACWSNPMQMTGQIECKWVGKSVQLPIGSLNLKDHIPENHLLRRIDRCLDLSDLGHSLADF
jgi:hypothetical protein